MLATSHGLRPITFYIEGSDVAGGYVQFLDYRFERQPGRVCDYFDSMNQLRAKLPWPQKPAAPPPVQSQKDFRIHVDPGGNFRTLQEAAMRVTAEYETNRQRARRQALEKLNEPNAQKIQDGRRINREFADMKRPRGKGAAFIVKSGE